MLIGTFQAFQGVSSLSFASTAPLKDVANEFLIAGHAVETDALRSWSIGTIRSFWFQDTRFQVSRLDDIHASLFVEVVDLFDPIFVWNAHFYEKNSQWSIVVPTWPVEYDTIDNRDGDIKDAVFAVYLHLNGSVCMHWSWQEYEEAQNCIDIEHNVDDGLWMGTSEDLYSIENDMCLLITPFMYANLEKRAAIITSYPWMIDSLVDLGSFEYFEEIYHQWRQLLQMDLVSFSIVFQADVASCLYKCGKAIRCTCLVQLLTDMSLYIDHDGLVPVSQLHVFRKPETGAPLYFAWL